VARLGGGAEGPVMFLALLLPAAEANPLDDLLARGEVTLLETYADGKLKKATAVTRIAAPIDAVWAKLVDWGAYEVWMPQCEDSTVVSNADGVATVSWDIAVVGPNVKFTGRYVMDPATHTIRGQQVAGALSGSTWEWKLTAEGPTTTLVEHAVRLNVVETNWIVRQVEDKEHTLDYGINISSAVVEARGLKRALGGK
jgi:carbon monoxide dehydrogenase subunit G